MPKKPRGPLTLQPGQLKATSTLVQARMDEVCERIALLHTTRQMMLEFAAAWGLTEDSVLQTYIKPARVRLREEYESAAPYASDRLRETLANLYQNAYQVGDHKTCVMIIRQLALIDGCNAPMSQTMNGSLGVEIAVGPGNPDATRERMKELLSRPEIQVKLKNIGLTHSSK